MHDLSLSIAGLLLTACLSACSNERGLPGVEVAAGTRIDSPGTYHLPGGAHWLELAPKNEYVTFGIGQFEEPSEDPLGNPKPDVSWSVVSLQEDCLRDGDPWFVVPEHDAKWWLYDGKDLVFVYHEKEGASIVEDRAAGDQRLAAAPQAFRDHLPPAFLEGVGAVEDSATR